MYPRTWIYRIQKTWMLSFCQTWIFRNNIYNLKIYTYPSTNYLLGFFYIMRSSKIKRSSSSERNIQAKLSNHKIDWPKCYTYARKSFLTILPKCLTFEILHNRLFFNETLHSSGLVGSPLCSNCGLDDEDPIHLFEPAKVTGSIISPLSILSSVRPCVRLSRIDLRNRSNDFSETWHEVGGR